MSAAPSEIDVLIVGGGPTGLMLAAGLAMADVRCRIVDQAAVRPDTSRALVVHARSLELLAKLGVADRLVARGRRSVRARTYVNRRPAVQVAFGGGGADDTPYPFALFVSQVETERVLDEFLAERGLGVERPLTLVDFVADDGGVRARLRHADGAEEEVRARYLVGCDGAHSAVRKGAGIAFDGAPYPQDFILADVEARGLEEDGAIHVFVARDGLLACFPMDGPGRYRLVASRADAVPPDAGAPTLEEFRALAASVCGYPLTFDAPRWLSRFRLHHRLAARYRAGPVFLAGDAAHIHSPAGGQGMNTGIQDAANLAWKLALVLRGRAPERLLDSYEAERQPVGRRLLRTTDRLFAVAVARNPVALGVAGTLLPRIAPVLLGRSALRDRAFRFISQLDIAYPRSPAVSAEPRAGESGFHGGPPAGHRAPDAPLAPSGRVGGDGGDTLFARMTGPAHHLLVFAGPDAAAMPAEASALRALVATCGDAVATHGIVGRHPMGALADLTERRSVDVEGVAHERYGLRGPGYYLVRPDGHVALRAASLDVAPLREHLDHVLRVV